MDVSDKLYLITDLLEPHVIIKEVLNHINMDEPFKILFSSCFDVIKASSDIFGKLMLTSDAGSSKTRTKRISESM